MPNGVKNMDSRGGIVAIQMPLDASENRRRDARDLRIKELVRPMIKRG
jgi:hypothetical protein